MNINSVFITGANRGIGLELVRQLVQLQQPPRFIFATYRNRDTAGELKKLRDATKKTEIHMIKMDVTNLKEVQAAKKIVEDMVGDEGLTLLINNAGLANFESFPNLTEDKLLFHFKTNTVGPIIVLQELLPLLKIAANRPNVGSVRCVSRAAVLTISSGMGSITKAGEIGNSIPVINYRISKAALNMAMRSISYEINDTGILIVMMCPGWVKTDMGTDQAELELPDSISAILKTLPTLNDSHHGIFISRHGEPYEF